MNPLDFATSADAVDSGVLRAKTRPIMPAAIIVGPDGARLVPAATSVASPTTSRDGWRSWWWLVLIAAGGYVVWRNQRKKR